MKTTSSLTADSTEVRYQKALKEINKLIGINTELREESNQMHELITDLESKIQAKDHHLTKIIAERNELEIKLANWNSMEMNITVENQELKKELQRVKSLNCSESFLRKKDTKDSYLENSENHMIISELEREIDFRNEKIKELERKIKENEKNLRIQNTTKVNEIESIKDNEYVKELERKLIVQSSYIDKLSAECVELKSQANKGLLNVRSMSSIPKYIPKHSPKSSNFFISEPQNSAEVLKRYHKLEEENKKLNKKNEALRNEIEEASLISSKLSKENSSLVDKVKSYETIINRQFEMIENEQKEFSAEILKKTKEFKERLLEQRESLSPGKQAENVKKIESLQIENKSLKKKFQLCSVELTKCFKTLEVYKGKLKEYEDEFLLITNEKEKLIEKLGRLQNSHRDRSGNSRGSMTKIIDTDRRSSMGETGCFNYT